MARLRGPKQGFSEPETLVTDDLPHTKNNAQMKTPAKREDADLYISAYIGHPQRRNPGEDKKDNWKTDPVS